MCKEHPQAHLLRAIADGKQIQWADKHKRNWRDCGESIVLQCLNCKDYDFRIKPETIMVNGVVCPKPTKGSGSFYLIVQLYGAGAQRVLTFASEADARQVFDAVFKPLKEMGCL